MTEESHTPSLRKIRKSELMVFSEIKTNHLNPTQIKKKLEKELTANQVDYAVECLKDNGFIHMPTYAVWEATVPQLPERIRKKAHRVTMAHTPTLGKKKHVRGHGITMTLKVPKLLWWSERRAVLDKKKILWKPIPQGERIRVDELEKVWLCNNGSVVFYTGSGERGTGISFFAEDAVGAAWSAMNFMINKVKRLERMLGLPMGALRAGLTIEGTKGYKLTFSRQHYALIENALAKQYDKEKKKLYIFGHDGKLWLVIDNSWNLHEMETVNAKSAVPDNILMDRWGNELRDTQLTPKVTLDLINQTNERLAESARQIEELAKNNAYYAENNVSHVASVQDLGKSALANSRATELLTGTVDSLMGAVRDLKVIVEGALKHPAPREGDESAEEMEEAPKKGNGTLKSFVEEETAKPESYNIIKVRFVKDSGEFYGLVPDTDRTLHEKVLSFLKGQPIALEEMTAKAVIKAGLAVEEKW